MKLIKPSNISGEIMTLMEEADEKVILISPYCKFIEWQKLTNKFRDLQNRNIDIEFYVREGELKTIREVEALNIIPITIPRLHAKLYLNETYAIVTSMNLTKSSDDASLDIGYKTENQYEYLELLDFYQRYILKHKQNNKVSNQVWGESLYNVLCNTFKRVNLNIDGNNLQLNTGLNDYNAFVASDYPQRLLISGILSSSEFQQALQNKDILENNIGCSIELHETGKYGGYATIWATAIDNMKSESLAFLKSEEVNDTIDIIVKFAVEVDNFKMSCR